MPQGSPKEDISRWLRWWTGFLELWGLGKLVSLYSPSKKYDPIVKMVSSEPELNGYLTNPNARAMARLKEYEIETRKMTQFKEKLRAIQNDDKESLLEECSEYGRPDHRKDHRADSEIPSYDLTEETESEEEANESEQEQDQREAEPIQGLTITPYITRPTGEILQQIAQARQELQETARQGALLSAALERHKGNLQRMANTPSHREHDPTQSKVRDLTFQFEQEAKENSASNQLRMTGKTDVEGKEPRKVSQKSDRVMMRKVLDLMPTNA
ncbi:hypothetical protein ILYODFUR_037094 [Ilyodon furcidens]|uniref:Uncharacterized protein n=1 Tax=Ilyodon furcidens TaxID=33524 RepID=A0ABV0TE77_9TELE